MVVITCSLQRCMYTLFPLLCLVQTACAYSYGRFQTQRWGGRGPRLRTLTQPQVSFSPSSSTHPAEHTSGPVPSGKYYERLYNRILRRPVSSRAMPTPSPPLSPSPTTNSVTDIPARLAALIPPGGTLDDIPKSQLAVLTGDPDYTRFRQAFLREMCQRLLNGPRAKNFQFCFSLLAF